MSRLSPFFRRSTPGLLRRTHAPTPSASSSCAAREDCAARAPPQRPQTRGAGTATAAAAAPVHPPQQPPVALDAAKVVHLFETFSKKQHPDFLPPTPEGDAERKQLLKTWNRVALEARRALFLSFA
jgi:hypothetical protein